MESCEGHVEGHRLAGGGEGERGTSLLASTSPSEACCVVVLVVGSKRSRDSSEDRGRREEVGGRGDVIKEDDGERKESKKSREIEEKKGEKRDSSADDNENLDATSTTICSLGNRSMLPTGKKCQQNAFGSTSNTVKNESDATASGRGQIGSKANANKKQYARENVSNTREGQQRPSNASRGAAGGGGGSIGGRCVIYSRDKKLPPETLVEFLAAKFKYFTKEQWINVVINGGHRRAPLRSCVDHCDSDDRPNITSITETTTTAHTKREEYAHKGDVRGADAAATYQGVGAKKDDCGGDTSLCSYIIEENKLVPRVYVNNFLTLDPYYILKQQDRVAFVAPPALEPTVDGSFTVLYNDPLMIIVSKSGNIPVTEGGRYRHNTLIRYVKEYLLTSSLTTSTTCTSSASLKEQPNGKEENENIRHQNQRQQQQRISEAPVVELYSVHRLDKETSGIVVFAKTKECAAVLSSLFAEKSTSLTSERSKSVASPVSNDNGGDEDDDDAEEQQERLEDGESATDVQRMREEGTEEEMEEERSSNHSERKSSAFSRLVMHNADNSRHKVPITPYATFELLLETGPSFSSSPPLHKRDNKSGRVKIEKHYMALVHSGIDDNNENTTSSTRWDDSRSNEQTWERLQTTKGETIVVEGPCSRSPKVSGINSSSSNSKGGRFFINFRIGFESEATATEALKSGVEHSEKNENGGAEQLLESDGTAVATAAIAASPVSNKSVARSLAEKMKMKCFPPLKVEEVADSIDLHNSSISPPRRAAAADDGTYIGSTILVEGALQNEKAHDNSSPTLIALQHHRPTPSSAKEDTNRWQKNRRAERGAGTVKGKAALTEVTAVRRLTSSEGPLPLLLAGPTVAPHNNMLPCSKSSNSMRLVFVRIFTGRTHQIRVHLAAIGAPIVGDKLYISRPCSSSSLQPFSSQMCSSSPFPSPSSLFSTNEMNELLRPQHVVSPSSFRCQHQPPIAMPIPMDATVSDECYLSRTRGEEDLVIGHIPVASVVLHNGEKRADCENTGTINIDDENDVEGVEPMAIVADRHCLHAARLVIPFTSELMELYHCSSSFVLSTDDRDEDDDDSITEEIAKEEEEEDGEEKSDRVHSVEPTPPSLPLALRRLLMKTTVLTNTKSDIAGNTSFPAPAICPFRLVIDATALAKGFTDAFRKIPVQEVRKERVPK